LFGADFRAVPVNWPCRWTTPSFSLAAVIGIGVPAVYRRHGLPQNLPGMAVLRCQWL
jgi:predicted benzoate:H+ symporter BenE